MRLTGAELMALTLRDAGVELVAGIPGHTVIRFATVVAQLSGMKPFLVRHESAATFAADVYYRVSGKLAATFSHALPGAANAIAGVANAYADSAAMLLITGQTASPSLGRGAYQELSRQFEGDTPQLMRHVSKRVWPVRNATELPEKTLRALRVAGLGRPGPVVLDVSQEVWPQVVEIPGPPSARGYLFGNAFRPSAGALAEAAQLLQAAQRPLIVAGNGVNLGRARQELLTLATRAHIPVVTTVTGKGAFPENHPLSLGIVGWVGTGCANQAARRADVILAVGARMTETTTSSWQPDITFNFPSTKLIHADVDPLEIGNVFAPDVPLIGDAAETLALLAEAAGATPAARADWLRHTAQLRSTWTEQLHAVMADGRAQMSVGPVVAALREQTRGRPVNIVCDIGKHHKWLAQTFETEAEDYIISSMGAGTMGIGPAGALGAALARPDAYTVAWTGDGGMSMVPYVLPTAAEYNLPIVFVVIDDNAYGQIVINQIREFGQTAFSEFNAFGQRPDYAIDFVAMAQSCGVPASRVERPQELEVAFRHALDAGGPYLLDVQVDRSSMAPSGGGKKLDDIWNHPIFPWVRSEV